MGATCSADQHREDLTPRSKNTFEALPVGGPGCCQTRTGRLHSVEDVGDYAVSSSAVAMTDSEADTLDAPRYSTSQRDVVDDTEWRAMQAAATSFIPLPADPPLPRAAAAADVETFAEWRAKAYGSEVSKGYEDGVWRPGDPEVFYEAEPEDPEDAALRERYEALDAVTDNRKPLYTVAEHLRSDKEIVLAAIRNEGGYCFDYIASQALKEEDRDVVYALVLADGSLLKQACQALRNDRDVVRAALMTYADALKYASPSLAADKDLQLIAASRAKEESRLMKMLEAKCGPAVSGCVAATRPKSRLGIW